jgi:hypothetical protein
LLNLGSPVNWNVGSHRTIKLKELDAHASVRLPPEIPQEHHLNQEGCQLPEHEQSFAAMH